MYISCLRPDDPWFSEYPLDGTGPETYRRLARMWAEQSLRQMTKYKYIPVCATFPQWQTTMKTRTLPISYLKRWWKRYFLFWQQKSWAKSHVAVNFGGRELIQILYGEYEYSFKYINLHWFWCVPVNISVCFKTGFKGPFHLNNYRLHHCLVRGWLKYGLHSNLLQAVSFHTLSSNVSLTSPVFTLEGNTAYVHTLLVLWSSR